MSSSKLGDFYNDMDNYLMMPPSMMSNNSQRHGATGYPAPLSTGDVFLSIPDHSLSSAGLLSADPSDFEAAYLDFGMPSPAASPSMLSYDAAPLTTAQMLALTQVHQAQQLRSHGLSPSDLTGREMDLYARRVSLTDDASADMRRQMHIKCEQNRRRQIKGGFDDLKVLLPGMRNKKLSKAAVLAHSIHYLKNLKAEVEAARAECARLKQM